MTQQLARDDVEAAFGELGEALARATTVREPRLLAVIAQFAGTLDASPTG